MVFTTHIFMGIIIYLMVAFENQLSGLTNHILQAIIGVAIRRYLYGNTKTHW